MPIDPGAALSINGQRRAYRAWLAFEKTLRRGMRDLVPPFGVDPWAEALGRQRVRLLATHQLGETFRQTAGARMVDVAAGELTLLEWYDEQAGVLQTMVVSAAQVGIGGPDIEDEATRARLLALLANMDARMASLTDRAGRPEDDPERITYAQAGAWAGQAGRGAVRTAEQMGGASWFGSKPVRRVMGAGERHCFTCPGKVRPYASLEECIAACGGWPGDGSDDCHGNCYCSIEPADAYSAIPGAEGVANAEWVFTPLTVADTER